MDKKELGKAKVLGRDEKMKESETLELKKSTSELKEAMMSIAAILNKHKKGELYFGIKNSGEVIGQDVSDKTLRDVSHAISDNIEPKIFPHVKEIDVSGKKCVVINFEGHEAPYFAYGRAYTRVGTENKQISVKELENMILHKNKEKLRWDNQICEKASLNDIDEKTIKFFIELTKKSKRLNLFDENKKTLLKKLNLINDKGKLTNAAILLFGKMPLKFFGNCIIKCGRFKGELKEEFLDILDLEGNLFDNLKKAIDFLKEHLRLTAKIEGLYRTEKWEIPLESLREAIINALIHRDYLSQGFSYIKIYDDKIIITNPGKLPNSLTLEDLYKEHESIPKNPLVARTVYYTGMIDVWGRGIQNIIKQLESEGLKKPIFEQFSGSFRVIFKRLEIGQEKSEGLSGGLSEGLKLLLEIISKNRGIKAKECSERLGRPIKTIERQIKVLREMGIIERKGSKKTGGYFIKNNKS